MLDTKLIRERPGFVRQCPAKRGAGDEARIGDLLQCDELCQRRRQDAVHQIPSSLAKPVVPTSYTLAVG